MPVRTILARSIERATDHAVAAVKERRARQSAQRRAVLDCREQERLADRWAGDFPAFCCEAVKILDKTTNQATPFQLWPCQAEMAEHLFVGDSLLILKARQIGITWLCAAYAIWRWTFFESQTLTAIFQGKEYAQDFLDDKCRFIHEHLPVWIRRPLTRDSATRLETNARNSIRAYAATRKAARSTTGDLVICDEAAYIEHLDLVLRAVKPTLEAGKGQVVILSSSDGPRGEFYRLWTTATLNPRITRMNANGGKIGGNSRDSRIRDSRRLFPLFFPWTARPGRTPEWYAAETKDHASDPLYMKREYPATPEEAFESAAGRVFPLFSTVGAEGRKFLRAVKLQPAWRRARGIDFGGVDPFVCLWAALVPGEGYGLSVSPDCPNLVRELAAYSYGPDGRPQDTDNHAVDALRYLVTSWGPQGVRGHLHVYRELYLPDSAAKGLALPDLARRIAESSQGERYDVTVADRSRPDSITLLCQCGIPTIPQRHLAGPRGTEIEQGLERVNTLVVGSAKGEGAARLPEFRPARLPEGFVPGVGRQRVVVW